jgi:hypothetical protein
MQLQSAHRWMRYGDVTPNHVLAGPIKLPTRVLTPQSRQVAYPSNVLELNLSSLVSAQPSMLSVANPLVFMGW